MVTPYVSEIFMNGEKATEKSINQSISKVRLSVLQYFDYLKECTQIYPFLFAHTLNLDRNCYCHIAEMPGKQKVNLCIRDIGTVSIWVQIPRKIVFENTAITWMHIIKT